jgi:hypothetical protein
MATYFFYNLDNEENCSLKTYDKSLRKREKFTHNIVSPSPNLDNEIHVTELIKELIPEYESHFYLFIRNEILKMAAIDDTMERLDSATELEPLNLNKSYKKEVLLTYTSKKLVYLDSYLKRLSETNLRKCFCQLISFYKSLINSITKLVGIRLVHNNISLDTLIVDEDDEVLFITKFDLTMDIRREKVLQFCSNQDNFSESGNVLPIEFHFLHYQLSNDTSLSLHNIETIIKKYLTSNFTDFTDLSNTNTNETFVLSYFTKYVNKISEYIVTDMIKYADTWDNFAASAAFKSILLNTLILTKKIVDENKFISQFMKLLETNMSLIPTHRNTLANTLELFDRIVLAGDFKGL